MKEITHTMYQTDDGEMFKTVEEATAHEAKIQERLKHTSYWRLAHGPDLTEGRGLCSVTYIQAYIPVKYPLAEEWVLDYVIRKYGRKVAFVQGVSPTPNWDLHRIESREELISKINARGFGLGSLHRSKVIYLAPGERESGLVETGEEK